MAFPLRERLKLNETKIAEIVHQRLEWVGLEKAFTLYPEELSGGMKKRVSIARALAADPKILFYDEPTTGLDPEVSMNIEDLIVKLRNELSLTSLVVTHQFSTIQRVSDRILMINNHRLTDLGSKTEAMNSSNPEAKAFFAACKVYVD